ncbi:MAG: hypothetical protein QM652_08010 [Legionella sp.]|uniref:hypothetical protein n=1 Tax=Legionella sp. TaxID=459 RepID=UPI0039E5F08C
MGKILSDMKKLCAISLTLLASNAFSEMDMIQQFKQEYGLLDNEIKIVKLKDFMKSTIKSSKDQRFMSELVENMKKTKKDMDSIGYTTKENLEVNALLNEFKDQSVRNYIKSKSSELSDTIDQFKIGYNYKIINPKFYNKHWGYSLIGGYNKCYNGECQEGWTGVNEIFEKDNLTCKYSEYNTNIAHGGNELVEEFITYNINNNPTLELVIKDNSYLKSGFLYRISWFQKDFDNKLECASTTYSKETLDKVRSFAKEIDNR